MFVRQSTYDRMKGKYYLLKAEHRALTMVHNELMTEYNTVIHRINAHGGEALFTQGSPGTKQFSKQEIRKLVFLCHPDKHGNKKSATELTTKLIAMMKA